ncbi:MAG: OmpA family protein [Flammeovirgaceae bacterium]
MMKAFSFLILLLIPFLGISQSYSPIKTLSGHPGQVQNIRFSPNGKILASGGQFGKIYLWDAQTGSMIKRINAHLNRVNEVTFNATGTMLVSAGADGTARVWDVASGRLLGTYYNKVVSRYTRSTKIVAFAVFSKDSKYIFFAGDGGNLMRAQLGKDRFGIPHSAKPLHRVTVMDQFGREQFNRVTGGVLSGDGKAVVLTVGKKIKIISIYSGSLLREFTHNTDLNDVVWGARANQISTWSYDGYVTIRNYQTGRIFRKIKAGDFNDYSAAAFNQNGTLMVTGVAGMNANVWNVSTGKKIATLVGHRGKVRLARFSPVDNVVATASYDGTIRFWKVKEPDPIEEEEVNPDPDPVVKKSAPDTVYVEKIVYKDRIVKDTVYVDKVVYKDRIIKDTVFVEKEEADPVVIDDEAEEGDLEKIDLKVGKVIKLKHIQFEQGKHYLLPESFPELDKVIKLMQKNPMMEIELEGHTDNVGSSSKNMTLSKRRVTTAKNYICEYGKIAEYRVKTKAFGESKPIAGNNSEADRAKNRRVEMKILKL